MAVDLFRRMIRDRFNCEAGCAQATFRQLIAALAQ
jgi:hypothetical protein